MKKLLTISLFIALYGLSFAQDQHKVDSLRPPKDPYLDSLLKNLEPVDAYLEYGNYLRKQLYQYDKAMVYCKKSLKLANEMRDNKRIYNALLNVGVTWKKKGKLDKALKYYINSEKIADQDSSINPIYHYFSNNLI